MRRAWLLALLGLFAVSACRQVPAGALGKGAGEQPGLIFQGFAARASHRAQRVWEAQAVTARVYDAEQWALAQDVTITYYVDGKVASTARAREARMDLRNYDLDARGDVQVRASNGVILSTSRLQWDNRSQRASSQARVRVVRGGTVLTGRGFTADRELRDVRIHEDVQAEAISVEQLRREAATWPAP
jgi:LPS export ABC transporter protein LptC